MAFLSKCNSSVVICALLLTACGDMNHIDVAPDPDQPQMRAKVAVKVLGEAVQGKHDWNSIFEHIESQNRTGDFSWPDFWNELSRAKLSSHFTKPQLQQVLDLHGKACSLDAYRSYASFVLDNNLTVETLVNASQRKCPTALGATLTASVMKKLRSQGHDDQAIPLYLSEYDKDPTGPWMDDAQVFSESEWETIVEKIALQGTANLFSDLLRVQSQVLGELTWLEPLATILAHDTSKRDVALVRIGLHNTLEVLAQGTLNAGLTPDQDTKLFDDLAAALDPSLKSEWSQKFADFLLLRSLEEQVHGNLRFDPLHDLSWLEKLHRKFEASFRQDLVSAQTFLHPRLGLSLDSLWLSLRLTGFADPNNAEALKTLIKENQNVLGLSQILRLRLKMHALAFLKTSGDFSEFCKALTDFGVSPSSLSISQLSDALSQGKLSAGCFTLEENLADLASKIEFETETITQSFDSVLFSPYQSIQISAKSADLGMMDFSNKALRPDLPQLSPPEDFSSVAFPILLGFKLKAATGIFHQAGIYYVPFHFVYRQSRDGLSESRAPLAGYSGNFLTLELSSHFPPLVDSMAFISHGGAGQKFAGAMLGGAGDTSSWPLDALNLWFSDIAAGPPPADPSDSPILLGQAQVERLHRLFEVAERKNGKIELYVLASSIEALSSDQQAKVLKLFHEAQAQNPALDTSVDVFLKESLALLAGPQADAVIEAGSKADPLALLPAFDFETNFSVPAGNAGQSATPGKVGLEGSLTVLQRSSL